MAVTANNFTSSPRNGRKVRSLTTFRALYHRGYRYLWLGQLGHSASMWMEQVVRPLLILELTGSALQVGLVIAVRMMPQFVFGLLAGVIADRYNKLRVLIVSQTVTTLMHLVLAVLILSGHIKIWHIFITALISGGSMAFNQPARQSLVPRLVPPELLLNGLALNTAAMNVMRVLGAGLAGGLLYFMNYGEIYALNAAIFMFVIWTTTRITMTEGAPSVHTCSAGKIQDKQNTLYQDFMAGFHFIVGDRRILYLVGMAVLLFILAQPYQQVFIPLLALNVLDIGRSGAGWMLATTGVGALIGSLVVASVERLPRRGFFLMGFLIMFGLSLVLLSQSRLIVISALALIVAGGMTTTYNSLNTSLLLEKSPQEFHGRVMSLMSLDRGLGSVGAIIAGGLAQAFGPQLGLTVIAGTVIGLTVIVFLFIPTLRRIE